MNDPNDIEARLRAALEEVGLSKSLAEALESAGLEAVPSEPGELVQFLGLHLTEALVGHLHPATSEKLVQTLAERLLTAPDETPPDQPAPNPGGAEPASPEAPAPERGEIDEEAVTDVRTLPPPTDRGAERAYDDLVSGAVHDRVTPVWGTRRPELLEAVVWAIVSDDEALRSMAHSAAPAGTAVVAIDSRTRLEATLARRNAQIALVFDAESPSLPLDQVIAALTEDPPAQVLLWRMPNETRARLIEAVPHAHAWLPCDAEVSPAEIMQLLGA